jgi:predicted DNA-binding protein (UPF0251 family)
VKLRQVSCAPWATFFKPAGVPMSILEAVILTLEEVEAIRLKDMGDLHQEECAVQMGVSRATFHQILKSAHAKLADAIVNGKAIRVEGGTVAFAGGRFRCRSDGHEWILPPGPMPGATGATSVACPTCQSRDVQPVFPPGGPRHGGRGHGPGWGMRGRIPDDSDWSSDALPERAPEVGPRRRHGRRGVRR